MKKKLRIVLISGLVILFILIFLAFSPLLFKEKITAVLKNTANQELKTDLDFSDLSISFFRHFPHLTVSLADFSLKSSAPFLDDTLVSARDISFGINLGSLLGGRIILNRVYVNKGKVTVQYHENGTSNFDIYESVSDTNKGTDTSDTEIASIKIDHIAFIKTDFIYSDPAIPLKVIAYGINYKGNSDLNNNIFDLKSRVRIDSIDLYYDDVKYFDAKPLKADLETSINLTSLDIKLQKNNLLIKDIPFEFKGEFSFQEGGYTLFISLFSQFGKEYVSGSINLKSSDKTWISAKADINLDLEKWSKAFGVRDYELKGMYSMRLNAIGDYATGPDPEGKDPDPVIVSIPDFKLIARLSDGYFRYTGLPDAISGISFTLDASSRHNDYMTTSVHLDNLRATFMDNIIEGHFRINGLRDLPVEGHLKTTVDLSRITRVIPLDSLDVKGMLNLDMDVKGNYAPEKSLFPVTRLAFDLKNGYVKTKYYPLPVENINMNAHVVNSTGELRDTKINLDTLSFTFEENPFAIKASLNNPENLTYDILAHGSIDVAKLYALFSQEGTELNGFISMDLALKGNQADALAGRYGKLHNKGHLDLRDIGIKSEYLPKEFLIRKGVFRFENDKVWFQKFLGQYGASDITLDGHLSNVVNYILSENQPLKGSFRMKSEYLLVDELMVDELPVAGDQLPVTSYQLPVASDSIPGGVIIIPENLEVSLDADVKKVSFMELDFNDLNARIEVKEGMLLLKGMSFDVIGCKVAMDATYGSVSEKRAFFDFHVKADSFDIKRAYNEVEMFRTLSSAGKCEGIISLEYSLKGRLDEGMNPIYPSLEGNGVIRLAKVKVMGMKLFTSMSRNLEKEDIREPDLSKVELKTSIKKNVITLEKTRMRISGFRFRVGGETNFNGQLNLKARLGLPPLGIVGIPMRILGTQEKPKFKYGRGTADEDVEETDYTDEIPPEMLEKIRNAKATDLQDEPL